MYRIHLSEEQQAELQRRMDAHGVDPRTRNRLEMVRLSHAGFSIPWIARHVRRHEVRVRYWIKQFLTGGFDALPDQPHLGASSGITPAIVAALKQHLTQSQQTFTTDQIAAWIEAEYGVRRSTRQISRVLIRERLSYKRTARSLKHKQDPEAVARKAAELAVLEKGGASSDGSVPCG